MGFAPELVAGNAIRELEIVLNPVSVMIRMDPLASVFDAEFRLKNSVSHSPQSSLSGCGLWASLKRGK